MSHPKPTEESESAALQNPQVTEMNIKIWEVLIYTTFLTKTTCYDKIWMLLTSMAEIALYTHHLILLSSLVYWKITLLNPFTYVWGQETIDAQWIMRRSGMWHVWT